MRSVFIPLLVTLLFLALGFWRFAPDEPSDFALAVLPALLFLALWGVARRVFRGPTLGWNDRWLGAAALFATGMAVGGVVSGLNMLCFSYIEQQRVVHPSLLSVWNSARDFGAMGVVFGGIFGFIFGAVAALGVRRAWVSAAPRRETPTWGWVGAAAGGALVWLFACEVLYDASERFASITASNTYPPSPAFRALGAALTVAAVVASIASLRARPSRANAFRAAALGLSAFASTLVSYHCMVRDDRHFISIWGLAPRDVVVDGKPTPQTDIRVEHDAWGRVLVVRQPGGAARRTRLSFGPWRIEHADKFVESLRSYAANPW